MACFIFRLMPVQGLPLSLQVTLNEPATLLGTIQMAASDTRFRPDILVRQPIVF